MSDSVSQTLFDNDLATLSNDVTLSESAANFKRLTICYRTMDNAYDSATIMNPNNKIVLLASFTYSSAVKQAYLKARDIKISGTRITTTRTGTWASSGVGGKNEKCIAITQVIGYRN